MAIEKKVDFSEDMVAVTNHPELLIAFDQALSRLQVKDPLMGEVVHLRCFAGMTVKEVALSLQISPRNVDRHWAAAKAWLYREIQQTGK